MLVVGLTGGIGSGKTTIAKIFRDLGVPIIDADEIAHQITRPKTTAFNSIITHFGESFISTNGTLNRAKLRDKVFEDKTQLAWLENLLHPMIRTEIKCQIRETKQSHYCIVVIPLLKQESKSLQLLNRILLVDAPYPLQVARVAQRDHLSTDQIHDIIQTQTNREQRLALADDVIYNDKGKSELISAVKALDKKYRRLSK